MRYYLRNEKLDLEIRKTIDSIIQHDLTFSILKRIADTPGPSQCLTYSRGRIIEQILRENIQHSQTFKFDLDYQQTGNVAVMLGDTANILFVAHADEISYLLEAEPLDKEVRLLPFCNHMAENKYPAVNLHYDLQERHLKLTAFGTIFSRKESNHLTPYLAIKEGRIEIGDRVIFDYPMIRDDRNLVYGKVDNAAGVTACTLAIIALARLVPEASAMFVFTDEEEGPADSNSTFARGARRFVQRSDLSPDMLCVVVDEYDTEPGIQPSASVLFTEKESLCRGNVVPPHLYAEFKQFAKHIQILGIDVSEVTGYVSRSDSPALMEYFRNILLLGYSVSNSHFDHSTPCTSLDAVLALAKTIVWMTLALDIHM